MKPATFPKKRLEALAGLRFPLILCAVFNHGQLFFPSWLALNCPLNLSQAVSLFFLLSGFLLTYSSGREFDKKATLEFYVKRLSRLWPTHLCTLLLFIALDRQVCAASGAKEFLANLFLLHAWIPDARFYFSYNAPSWSISTFLFFYLIFPFLLNVANSKWSWMPVVSSMLLIGILVFYCNVFNLAKLDVISAAASVKGIMYISPLSRLLEFVCGMTLAVVLRRRNFNGSLCMWKATALEILAIGIVVYVSSNSIRWSSLARPIVNDAGALWMQMAGFTLVPFLMITAILYTESGAIARLLGSRLLVRAGNLSFGIYLLHLVLLYYWRHHFEGPEIISIMTFLAALLAGAYAIQVWVERPVQRILLQTFKRESIKKCGVSKKV